MQSTIFMINFAHEHSNRAKPSKYRLGDDAKNKQYRSLLHFDTAKLPDNAVITRVTQSIKKSSPTAALPTTLGDLVADMKKGFLGLAPLELGDFNAAGAPINTAGRFTVTTDSNWYRLTLSSVDIKYVKLFGITQFRLRFTKDDDNDKFADLISLYSGDTSTEADRPQLIVEYWVP
jgi:hypothetical protein